MHIPLTPATWKENLSACQSLLQPGPLPHCHEQRQLLPVLEGRQRGPVTGLGCGRLLKEHLMLNEARNVKDSRAMLR